MSHYTEDDLVLYHYGEGKSGREKTRREIEAHLDVCKECSATYRSIADTLGLVTELTASDVPERGDQYGLEVWQRIRHKLPEREPVWWMLWIRTNRMVGALATAALVLVAFAVGYMWPRSASDVASSSAARADRTSANGLGVSGPKGLDTSARSGAAAENEVARDRDIRRRILLVSIADHLDSSERVLTDIMNAPARSDISAEQRWANDLLTTSRLYRQDAVDAGEQSIASILDELERSLLEIVHSSPAGSGRPSAKSTRASRGNADLDEIRRRIDATALLFKVRVMSNELREREAAPVEDARPRTPTRQTS
jgi:hypothetical protein